MPPFLNLSAAAVVATFAISLSATAQEYDQPSILSGGLPEEEEHIVGSPGTLPVDRYDLPPSEAASADLSASGFSVGENATLELESRLFSNRSRDGGNSFFLCVSRSITTVPVSWGRLPAWTIICVRVQIGRRGRAFAFGMTLTSMCKSLS